MSFGYYSPISINSAQVPSTQTDFPVLVSQIDNRFKTVGNGGHVQDANGYDIRPYSDSGLSTAITGFELERYNASTGEVIMWVKVGSLSSSTTPIYLAYGDASLNTDGSSTTTWSNSFVGVYHLADGSTLSVNSSTGSNNGTNTNSVTATTGQIDGSGGFASASSQYIDLSTGIAPVAITLSAWVKATSFPNAYNGVIVRSNASYTSYGMLYVNSSGNLSCFAYAAGGIGGVIYDGTGSHTLSTGTWYYLTLTYSNAPNPVGGLSGYVNAASDHALVAVNGVDLVVTSATTSIGGDTNTTGRWWNGALDEVRVSGVARNADWITTEYNNQSDPATFETLDAEVSLSTFRSSAFLEFYP